MKLPEQQMRCKPLRRLEECRLKNRREITATYPQNLIYL